MRQQWILAALTATALLGAMRPTPAADAAFSKDLMATIALQGKRCDKIVAVKRNGDSNYDVTCRDGNRYHVYVNSKGRVVVDKQ